MDFGFFKPRYVRDYVPARKVKYVTVWAIQILAVILLGILIAAGFGKSTIMQEGSMDPTLSAGDTLLINRVAYRFGSPKRGDVVIFRVSDDEKASAHVKRIIGLPGETVQIRDGQILIDGETYKEKRNLPAIQNPGLAESTITLGSNEYFVLGDNRNNSEDSRFVDVGAVKKKNIIGKLWFRSGPWGKIGFLKK